MLNLNSRIEIASASCVGFAMTSLRGGTTKQSLRNLFINLTLALCYAMSNN